MSTVPDEGYLAALASYMRDEQRRTRSVRRKAFAERVAPEIYRDRCNHDEDDVAIPDAVRVALRLFDEIEAQGDASP